MSQKITSAVQREADGLTNLKAIFQDVLHNIKISQDRVRKRKALIGQEDYFKVGDRVLQTNIKQEQRKGGSWRAPCWDPSQRWTWRATKLFWPQRGGKGEKGKRGKGEKGKRGKGKRGKGERSPKQTLT
ncbi:hypothetical protein EYF80_055881 [Liparis tanakae]|uniref:Uncharacterized protein n=1 Tax=Liparis tanakae TaxID=230148 RepID=A0A4Z2EYB4_9TELE|nr:hypothetical protein EYF80_055881 [Liparis tanakae]